MRLIHVLFCWFYKNGVILCILFWKWYVFSHFKIFHQPLFIQSTQIRVFALCSTSTKFFDHMSNSPASSHSWHQFRFFLATFQKTFLAFLEIYFRIKLLSSFSGHVDKWEEKMWEATLLVTKIICKYSRCQWPANSWILNYKPTSDLFPLGLVNQLIYLISLSFYLNFKVGKKSLLCRILKINLYKLINIKYICYLFLKSCTFFLPKIYTLFCPNNVQALLQ